MGKLFALFLLAAISVTLTTSFPVPVMAQVPTADPVKSPSKISKFVNNVKAKVVHAYKWVADSKFGKFIGKAVDATKDGVSFAKDMYKGAMEVYGKVEDKIDTAKNSKTVKAGKISKEIADESVTLKELQEQKLKLAEDYKQNLEIERQTVDGKLDAINQNRDNAAAMGLSEADFDKDIDSLKTQLLLKENQLKRDHEDESDELDKKIKNQLKTVGKLTKELSEVTEVKMTGENPLEVIQKTQDDLFLKPGEGLTIDKEQELRNKFFEERRKVIYKSYEKALKAKAELDGMHADVQSVQDLASAMPGKSENSGVNAEVLIRQAEILRKYVEFVLADIELETTVEMAALNDFRPSDRLSKFRLCNYTDQKSGIAALKDKASSAKDKIGDAVAKGQEAKQKYDETKNDITQKVNDVQEMNQQMNDLKDNAGALTNGVDPQSAIKDML